MTMKRWSGFVLSVQPSRRKTQSSLRTADHRARALSCRAGSGIALTRAWTSAWKGVSGDPVVPTGARQQPPQLYSRVGALERNERA